MSNQSAATLSHQLLMAENIISASVLAGIGKGEPAGVLSQPAVIQMAACSYGPMLTFSSDMIIGQSLRTQGNFQERKIAEVTEFLASTLGVQTETFIDIGANIGTHLVFALKEGGFLRGIAIEPDANNYRLLVCNLLLNNLESRVSVANLALSDSDGWAELELSPDNFGDHRIRSAESGAQLSFGESSRETYKVPKRHAGDWFQGIAYERNKTLIWIDTQGHEGNIFHSFAGKPAAAQPKHLVAEFWPYGLARSGGRQAYLDYLARCDAVYDINAPMWQTSPPVAVAQLLVMYDTMLAATTADHYPHTDLLCVHK
jgi:FkbM family methyltransferase